jgi:UDP-N-acetylmuramyl tripeptide synthase
LTRLKGGHGSALPGLVVEKIAPDFLKRSLGQLPRGVVVISGTNGKTTTTKMVVDLLESAGLKILTNPSGSNFTRGVTSAVVNAMHRGRLDFDMAVVELDEAHAVNFVQQIKPRYSLLLNVLRDQLDRFGEIDATAKMLSQVAASTTKTVVLNADDPRLAAMADKVSAQIEWFGLGSSLHNQFPTDEQLHAGTLNSQSSDRPKSRQPRQSINVKLDKLVGQTATYQIGGHDYTVKLRLFGAHNALNGAAALGLSQAILGEAFIAQSMVERLGNVRPAFGRGEMLDLDGRQVRLILVKNPSGFRLSLASGLRQPTLIAINDAFADGRDVSWLYDVDFRSLDGVKLMTSGSRAFDMTLRLNYGGQTVDKTEPAIAPAIERFLRRTVGQDAQIFATYTAMLEIRKILKSLRRQV